MTRVNTIDVDLLPMPWLVAEYRELPRIINRVAAGKPFDNIPDTYRMGQGHVSFFGDKLLWLFLRHEALRAELIHRGGKPTMDCHTAFRHCDRYYPELCTRNWQPSKDDHMTNLHRLEERWTNAVRMSTDDLPRWLRSVVKRHNL